MISRVMMIMMMIWLFQYQMATRSLRTNTFPRCALWSSKVISVWLSLDDDDDDDVYDGELMLLWYCYHTAVSIIANLHRYAYVSLVSILFR